MYGYTNYNKKKEQWDFIHQISENHSGLWILIGDLNFHLTDINNSSSSSIDGLVNSIIQSCGLEDIGFVGKDYTWSGNNLGSGTRRSRIDMALGNVDWNHNYPNSKLLHLTQSGSDHSPIMLVTNSLDTRCWKPFKFFLTWLEDETCTSVIEEAWNINISGSPGFQLVKKFQSARKRLSIWNITIFGNVNQRVEELQKELDVLQSLPPSDENHNKILCINKDFNKWHKIRSEFYQQKSRDHFIKDMDNNSKYFHTKTNRRRVRNNIDAIQDHANNRLLTREEISQHLTSHYKRINTSVQVVHDEGLFLLLPTIITEDDNNLLTRVPSHQEIHDTLKGMENWSAPGPEGFQAGFYKSQWTIIGDDIIVTRLKPLMEKIISPYQAAYVSGRLISDNTVIAQEIIHSMKKKREYFGFSKDLCELIYQCISTTSLSVILNGSPCEEFLPTRGIRQDDCLIFTQANLSSVNKLLELLHNFSTQSGQMINFDKSSVHFSKNTKPEVAETLTHILGVKTMRSKERYLGSPLLLGHSKQEAFKAIEENILNRYFTWSSTSLTQVGRSTMIKHVLNSLPAYQIGTFKLPTQLLNRLSTIQRKFFWGHNSNRGYNPIGWKKVCKFKYFGGLSFRDLEKLNLALLTKLFWRLCTESEALWTKIMSSKYFKHGNILHQDLKKGNCSYTWNGIIKGLQVVQQNYFMEVNNGKKTKIWLDRWIPGDNTPPHPINDLHRFYQDVDELILPNTNNWNVELLNQIFDNNTSQKIHNLFLDTSKEDIMVWMPARDGKFSVKSTYKKLTMNTSEALVNGRIIQHNVWKRLWKSMQERSGDWSMLILMNRKEVVTVSQSGLRSDASFDEETNTLGAGIVLRTHAGTCEGIRGFHSDEELSLEAGECMDIREALQWTREKKFTSIHIEADAKLVVQSIIDNVLLIQDDNRVADEVAISVRESATHINLLNNFSEDICSLMARDINASST
ncbi:uncharacterized protein LOC113330916 [Papaver somniferum]|uniref:uncharacterized protein LOC113330916 n=1 Tax=Papaver somniferum TaxID=3469 RepID=UPI000E7046BF|nr:uncharacterized protein LOC113330916 [Papaver somniferum]